MNHKVFIPVTDEMLYERPDLITAPLKPYLVDQPCFHWMATIESPEAADDEPRVNMRFDHTMQLPMSSSLSSPALPVARPLNDPLYRSGSRFA